MATKKPATRPDNRSDEAEREAQLFQLILRAQSSKIESDIASLRARDAMGLWPGWIVTAEIRALRVMLDALDDVLEDGA